MEILKENQDQITYLIKRNQNDYDLGREVRKLFFGDPLVMRLPNDGELGYEIRKIYRNLKK